MRTVAIACQGGGSHTAFTGGVLHVLHQRQMAAHYSSGWEMVGTSIRGRRHR